MSGEREIAPGQRRLERIRAEHGLPVRQSPVAIGVLVGGAAGTALGGVPQELLDAVRDGLSGVGSAAGVDGAAAVRACVASVACIAWPSLAGGMAGGTVGALAQTGMRMRVPRLGSLAPRAPRLSALGGPMRVLWALALLAAAAGAVGADWAMVAAMPSQPLAAAVGSAAAVVTDAVLAALGAGVLFALCDVLAARRRWERAARMTAEEAREDHRHSDGDPTARSRRRDAVRRMHAGLARGREARASAA